VACRFFVMVTGPRLSINICLLLIRNTHNYMAGNAIYFAQQFCKLTD